MEDTRNTICVAMCTYNGAQFVVEQLESMAAQTRLPDRVVVFDDCSKDDTVPLLQAFAKHAPFAVEVHRNPANLGYVKNFEQAIRQASGDIIVLADQDDVWLPNKLEVLAGHFAQHPQTSLVFTDAQLVDRNLAPFPYTLWQSIEFDAGEQSLVRQGAAFDVLLRRNVVTGATAAFRGDIKEQILPIPAEWVHDEWIAIVLSVVGQVGLIDEPLIKYRQHGANQIGARKRSIKEKLQLLFVPRANFHQNLLLKTELLRDHLADALHLPPTHGALRQIAAKIEHLRVRANMPRARLLRTGVVFSEVLRGNYSRYASGFRSVVRDLCEPLDR